MNFILVLKELWQRRLFVALATLAAAMVAVLVVYDVGLMPPSLAKRDHVEARGEIEILVDSPKSPIGDVGRDLTPLSERAGVFARYIAGGNVIDGIAKDTGIPASRIQVVGPAALPGEAPGSEGATPHLLPYGIEIVQRDELPILNVVTRAPTVDEARGLAAATPAAARQIVSAVQREQGIPDAKRVTFRALGPAQADLVADAVGAKVALLVFFVVFALLILLILGAPRLVAAWQAVDVGPAEPSEHPPALVKRPQLEMPQDELDGDSANGSSAEGSKRSPAPFGSPGTV